MIKFKWTSLLLILAVFILTTCTSHSHDSGGVSHWRAPESARPVINPKAGKVISAYRGKIIFDQNCSGCHGYDNDDKDDIEIDGESSEPIPPHVLLLGGHHSDGELAWKIQKGRGEMPSWEKKLSENQIWDVVSYIQSLKLRKK